MGIDKTILKSAGTQPIKIEFDVCVDISDENGDADFVKAQNNTKPITREPLTRKSNVTKPKKKRKKRK